MKLSRIVQLVVLVLVCVASYLLFSGGGSETVEDSTVQSTP